MAYFALDYSQGPETEFYLTAVDAAGNSARSGFPHYVRKRSFKKDVIALSDAFLSWKMPEFDVPGAQNADLSLPEKFLKVNRDLRKSSYQQLIKETEKTEPNLLWKGNFLRLPNSARQAGFADHRAYNYKGRTIDRQVHLGVDLASTAHSRVPAANSGIVAFVGDIGIYGKTVIIDHGFGLFSMYSHLSGADVQSGETVERGKIIGSTGVTGLAGGDHLHFGMMIHHAFVDPIEWWDPAWIKNNITDKISSVKSTLGAE
jgi:murein DD-endopeptidase MepM/ murein hydrolase activator NlpD